MKLSTEQLTEIKNYIEDMDIKYLDVQMEILDHTACKVEEIMLKNPEWSFKDAFYQSTYEFGYNEYKDFEKSFANTARKRSSKIFRSSLKEWFLSFKIVYTLLIAVIFALVISGIDVIYANKILLAIYLLFDFYYLLLQYPKYRKFSTIRYSVAMANAGGLILVWNQFIYDDSMVITPYVILAYTTFSTLSILIILASHKTRKKTILRCEQLSNLYKLNS